MSITFYLFLFTLFVLLVLKNDRLKEKSFVFFCLFTFFHAFIDPNSVTDLPTYKESFVDAQKIHFASFVKDIGQHMLSHKEEIGYVILSKLSSLISIDFSIYLCICSSFFIGLFLFFIKDYSSNIKISYLLLLLIVYDQSIFVLRQYLSIAILTLSFKQIVNRNIVRYSLIVLLAFLFHKSSIIWFPIYFIYGINNHKLLMGAMVVATFLLFFVFENLSSLNDYFALGYYSYIEGGKTGDSNLTSFFLSLFFLLCFILSSRQHIFEDGINKICFISLCIYVIMSVVGVKLSLIGRFSVIFYISLLFVIPRTFLNIKNMVLKLPYIIVSFSSLIFINYFGTFSQYLKNMKLVELNFERLRVYIIFCITFYIIEYKLIKSNKKVVNYIKKN